MAIPAFGFEGHFTAAVSRGRRPVDRAAGAALRLIDLTRVLPSYSRWLFFLLSSIRSDEDWRLLAFLSSSITSTDKNCSQTKKRPCKRSSRLSGGLLVSEFFQSEKQRSLNHQRHWSDGLRWANRKSIVTQSLNWKRGPFSLSRSWYRTLTDVQTPIVSSITHKQTWLHMNTDVDCKRNSSHQV